MIILTEITPYDPAQSAEVTVRLSSGALVPHINGQHWRAKLGPNLSLGMAIFEDGFETAGSSRTAGQIEIFIGDDGDEYTAYDYNQRSIKIWTGESNDFADFTLRFDGFTSAVRFDEKLMQLTLSDKSPVFDHPVDFPTYGGTGGMDGPAEMAGVVKPYCFGPVFNMEPTLVDAVNLIYQVHNRACQAIDGIFDQAVELTSDGDTTDLAAWAAIPGKYKTDLSKGLFKLGAKPAGLITADVQGDAAGGYVTSAGDILQRLLQFIPDSAGINIDAPAFTALNLANDAPVSIHARAALTARDLFNVLMRSVGGYWLVDWLGNLTVGIHDLAPPVASLAQRHIGGLSREDSPAPVWRLKTTYRPTYRVQSGSEIAAADLGGGMRGGSGVPVANLGIIDDLYIDTDNGKLYKKTAVSTWEFQYDTTGTTGAAGDTWLDGAGVPAGALGTIGDYYLNSVTGDYYKKTAASIWTLQGNIAGPQGNQGNQGNDGADGATGLQGVPGPPGADGTPRYTWIAYANSSNGVTNFTTGAPSGHKYIGLAHNKTTASESQTPGDYIWNLVEGPQGNAGTTGATGSDGIDGNYIDIKFTASAGQPATPAGNNPVGWSDYIPGSGTVWQSRATKTAAGTLVGIWATPALYRGSYRGAYSAVATYFSGDSVTYDGRSFICTTALVAGVINITPPTSNSSNATWDLTSAKGDSGDPPSAFNETAVRSNGAALNMRLLADSLGYDGASDATFTVTVSNSITANTGSAVSSGAWPAGKVINLTLIVNSGVILQGAGGNGGNGGSAIGSGSGGGAGGHGVRLLENLSITNNGTISGGSGGGGGGGGRFVPFPETMYGGGGAGGGWPNGSGGSGGSGTDGNGSGGGNATSSNGGSSGSGAGSAGSGGSGGGKSGISPINGNDGIAGSQSGGSGGTKGDGIKKNGHTLTLSGSGQHSGIGS